MAPGNWNEITPSGFAWEREALEHVRRGFPKHAPYAAWTNFEFFDGGSRLYEVDLLLCTPKGLHLVEVKSWPGLIEGDDHTWRWTDPDGRSVARDSPLRLANTKAKALKSLLARSVSGHRVQLPFVTAWVFLSTPDLEVRLTEQGRVGVLGRSDPDHRRPGVLDLQRALVDVTPADHEQFRRRPGRRLDRPTGELIVTAMREAGIKPSNRMRTVGEYRLEQLLVEGPGYQDFAGEHETLKARRRRVRIYNAPPSADDPRRQALRRAARRESQLLEGLQHPGLLPIEGYVEHDLGPALVLGIAPDRPTLDAWLTEYAARLSLIDKLTLLREIVDAVRYAHSHGLVHRGLSPRSIFISDEGQPRIGDWHTGARIGAEVGDLTLAGTRDPGALAASGAEAYLAPETAITPELDPTADVFSLGAVAWLLVTGQPPAERASDLLVALRESGGLDLAAAVDGVGPRLRDLVRSATAPAIGDRLPDAEEFLVHLSDALEEAHEGEAEDAADPLLADKGDVLTDVLIVERALGAGSTARALLVQDVDSGQRKVLKVALDEERAGVLRDEFEVLEAVVHPAIVHSDGLVRVSGRTALVLQFASEGTVARRLREEGPFGLELLERLGVDLLQALIHLEREGYLHRDVKPDNLGLAPAGKNNELHLLLLDFSLSRADPASLRAGTPNYVDPFLGLGERRRFDAAADRWAAGVTLHEMATGRRPVRGDGRSNPAATGADVAPVLDVVDPAVRPRLQEFFERGLCSDVGRRFHTAQEMLDAWRAVFSEVTEPAAPTATTAEDVDALLDAATLATPLAAAGLSVQQVAALERHNVVTVADLVTLPGSELSRLRGVGNRMRRELMAITGRLRRSLADEIGRAGLSRAQATATTTDEPDAPDVQGLDALVLQLAPERAPDRKGLHMQRVLLSLPEVPGGTPASAGTWPTTQEVGAHAGVSAGEARLARDAGLRRWGKLPAITRLRASLASELERSGGVATADEMAVRVLAIRGSVVPDAALRLAYARAATRAAIEVEVARGEESRFTQRRAGARVVLASTTLAEDAQSLLDRALALGREADVIVSEDRLLAPAQVLARLHEVDSRLADVPLLPARLLALAAAASDDAAASPRGELYPVGMPAARAVVLAQGALLGAKELTFAEVRDRIVARYPEAELLPSRPQELEGLLQQARVDLTWRTDPARKEGGVFLPAALPVGLTGLLGSTSLTRGQTTGSLTTADARRLEAADFDRMLGTARRDGGPFFLLAAPREVARVRRRLVDVHGVVPIDVERFVLDQLRRLADSEGIDWSLLARTDVAGPTGAQWSSLVNVFSEVFDSLTERVSAVGGVPLLHRAGLLARYGGLDVLRRLRAASLHGWWLLIAQDEQIGRPLLDGAALEVRGDYEWARVPAAWIPVDPRSITAA
ncbi:BREX system serine/threonine kinase PglW [Baekduia sp. Peel2402]|uniref:BREX system serine/threonine kinase PglW n=1 Tax=Baekduia sp. Peel2402 TaxID=3458296 RepID=UPI00403ECF90